MTDKQLEALSQSIVADVRGASVLARSQPVANSPSKAAEQASLEEKLAELQQRNLPYEQYQQEYRRIVEGGE